MQQNIQGDIMEREEVNYVSEKNQGSLMDFFQYVSSCENGERISMILGWIGSEECTLADFEYFIMSYRPQNSMSPLTYLQWEKVLWLALHRGFQSPLVVDRGVGVLMHYVPKGEIESLENIAKWLAKMLETVSLKTLKNRASLVQLFQILEKSHKSQKPFIEHTLIRCYDYLKHLSVHATRTVIDFYKHFLNQNDTTLLQFSLSQRLAFCSGILNYFPYTERIFLPKNIYSKTELETLSPEDLLIFLRVCRRCTYIWKDYREDFLRIFLQKKNTFQGAVLVQMVVLLIKFGESPFIKRHHLLENIMDCLHTVGVTECSMLVRTLHDVHYPIPEQLKKRFDTARVDYQEPSTSLERHFHTIFESFGFCTERNTIAWNKYSERGNEMDVAISHSELKLNIECDGARFHADKKDKIRDKRIESMGWKVLRVSSREINTMIKCEQTRRHFRDRLLQLGVLLPHPPKVIVSEKNREYRQAQYAKMEQRYGQSAPQTGLDLE